jgi:protein translocase SecG subunit
MLSTLLLLVSLRGFLVGTLLVLHVLICILLVAVVLFQQRGRSADLASAFGAGPTQTNVAALSSEDVITKATKYGAFLFMATSLVLALFPPGQRSLAVDRIPTGETQEAPASTEPETPAADSPAAAPAEGAGAEAAPADAAAVPGPAPESAPAQP